MQITKAACIGGGVIGAGWVARLVLNGIDVALYDPDPQASRKVDEVLAGARRAYLQMVPSGLPKEGRVTYVSTVAEAVGDADFIQESVPERLDLKHKVLAEIDAHARPDALIGSSTSGIKPTEMASALQHPERLVVAHPFNPVYLLPLVEIVGGEKTAPEFIDKAKAVYASIGMKPVVIRKEIEAFVGDRLLEAIWRESLWLIKDGITTVEELDDIIRYSFGLRWAQMGLFQTYRIAGGEAGMRHFMEQFGPCLSWPWTKLTDVPEFNDELVDLIAGQSDEQSGHYTIRELEKIRDDNLVAIMGTLAQQNEGQGWGAGALQKDYVARLKAAGEAQG
ncbi:carnitine 3-dehydrogenase [Tianweitania populi]|uniref:L-carnitine dehydrogenase n=1 Tax=Tianweitania populi TaxID=1607949 RepID=A0A8J3DKK3_9HYPH|nr:L-carnitine dehydrogenase [Tianweitania populi]